MTHIPGPYDRYIGEGNDIISITKWIDGPRGGKMAMSLAKIALPSKPFSQEQMNDTARLFQAAPAMLEALKFAETALDQARSHIAGETPDEPTMTAADLVSIVLEIIDEAKNSARAAIKLAETV